MLWRLALLRAVTPDDFDAVAATLIRCARQGDSWAVKEFFNRLCGRSMRTDPPPIRVAGDVLIDARRLTLEAVRPEVSGLLNRWLEAPK